jgi:ERCC4-type nuclease
MNQQCTPTIQENPAMEKGEEMKCPKGGRGAGGEPRVPPNMKIILDERESTLYDRCVLLQAEHKNKKWSLEKRVIPLGDAIIQDDEGKDLIIIERKSIQDLLASIKDGRYAEQSHRLQHSSGVPPHNVIYIIEGSFANISSHHNHGDPKQTVYSCMVSLSLFKGFGVLRTTSVQDTADVLVSMVDKMIRNFEKGQKLFYSGDPTTATITEDPAKYCSVVKKVKKDNVTPENMGEIILCQIPGISSTSAIAIMQKFNSFLHLIESIKEDPKCLDQISYETNGKSRKVSKTSIENIKKYLLLGNLSEAKGSLN